VFYSLNTGSKVAQIAGITGILSFEINLWFRWQAKFFS